jgi:hypothetical protein
MLSVCFLKKRKKEFKIQQEQEINNMLGSYAKYLSQDLNQVSLLETLDEANQLFTQVSDTQQAQMDAKLLKHTALAAAERVNHLQVDGGVFDFHHFVSLLSDLDLKKASLASVSIAPLTFMLGPLAIEPKVKYL